MNMMRLTNCFILIFACLTLMSTGCATKPPSLETRIDAYRSQTKDPRRFWLTIYDSSRGPVVTGGQRLHPNQTAALPFISPRKSNMPLINFRELGDEFYIALIDTSAGESWVELDDAMFMGLTPLGPPEIFREPLHIRDAGRGLLSLSETFRFDLLYVESALLYTRLQPANGDITRGNQKPRPHVILGGDFLKQFRFFQLNFPNRSVNFSATHPYKPYPDNLLAELPLKRLNNAVVVEAVIDGKAQWTVLDSAGDYELSLPYPEAETVRQLMVGDLVFRHVNVTSHNEQQQGWPNYPKIGLRLLSKFKITVDNKLNKVYFEKPLD